MAIVLFADPCMEWIVTGLSLSGYQVTRCSRYELRFVRLSSCDLIVLDLAWPEPDERVMIAQLLASGRPLILLYDREREDVARYGLPSLVKPVAFRSLLHLVERSLASVPSVT